MKRKMSIFTLVLVSALFSACGKSDVTGTSQQENVNTTSRMTDQITETVVHNQDKRSLVIYFDYSENIDTTGMDVDAISTASLRGGSNGSNIENMQVMVKEVKDLKSADVYSIRVNEVYPALFDDMTGMAKDDITDDRQFTFKEELTGLENYDTVYIGVPVWWGELPQPVQVFFDKYDFSGKTLVPFGIHHGSGFGRMVIQMREYEPDAEVLAGFTINADTDNNSVKEQFDEYLGGL